jgi:hypothetical protein
MNSDNKKIYDVITYNNEDFFLDKEFKLIFNNKKDIIGVYENKNNLFFWNTIDNIINSIIHISGNTNQLLYPSEIDNSCNKINNLNI